MCGQREVAEVVAAELELEAVGGGFAFGSLHHSGVVDQDVDGPALAVEFRAEGRDACEGGQVEVLDGEFGARDGGADLCGRRLAFGAVADGHDDVGSRGGKPLGDAEAKAAVRPGDDCEFSGKIGHAELKFGHDFPSLRVWERLYL